jgi:DNA-binding Lrp family transcriptional regulator
MTTQCANAKLISKAPEMLEVLKKVSQFITENEDKNYMVRLLSRDVPEIEKLIIDTKSDFVKFKAAFQIQNLEDFSTLEAKDAIHALKEKRSNAMKPKKENANV